MCRHCQSFSATEMRIAPLDVRSSELQRPGVSCGRVDPIRTCLGCRTRSEPALLVRIAAQGGQAVVDEGRRLPGRGAWVHPTQQCAERAIRAIPRALRQHVDTSPIARWAQDGLGQSPDRRNERPMDN
ncbi:YlxR family protein [Agrococcus terreus]|uniref:YlxR domain-containing protein n=1 Tax=Agrococcus terreus TaxID=574649 RepID=A0ABQ2KL69_9MICO|nr:YlxR family protein [Agrococcus terreus]GGN86523.1 hypothetical protein GCM10010968_20190 [Agrococcus terreus]